MENDWDLYTALELAEMWYESRGITVQRTKVDDDWVLMAVFDIGGEPHNVLLHQAELDDRADEWVYENE